MPKAFSRRELRRIVRDGLIQSIEDDPRMYNLARGYWVYDEMLAALRETGWRRFGPGFKGAVYGRAGSDHCVKVLGMGVGADPLYFCERGYYLEHEQRTIRAFRDAGFAFAPDVLDLESTIRFLVDRCGVRSEQAALRASRHDVLVMERIRGVPLAIQTGRGLTYDLSIDAFDAEVLAEMERALERLRLQLERANVRLLLHNDPMPPNIVFSMNNDGGIVARLVDFEIAQNLGEPSPDFVSSTVAELYRERAVPRNPETGHYLCNLDAHLLAQSAALVSRVRKAMEASNDSILDAVEISAGIITVQAGTAWRQLCRLFGF